METGEGFYLATGTAKTYVGLMSRAVDLPPKTPKMQNQEAMGAPNTQRMCPFSRNGLVTIPEFKNHHKATKTHDGECVRPW